MPDDLTPEDREQWRNAGRDPTPEEVRDGLAALEAVLDDGGRLRWPSPEQSREIIRDLVDQVGPTGYEDGPLPEDPDDPGEED